MPGRFTRTGPYMNARVRDCMKALIVGGLFVAHPMGAQSGTPRIQLVREHVIDGEREDFPVVNGGHVNSRADIALTMRQDFQVRVYDVNGKRLATVGRRGQAPGEFMAPQVQGWFSDTVWVFDPSLRRSSFFSRDGRLVRTAALETSSHDVRVLHDSTNARLIDFFPRARRDDGTLVGSATIVRSGTRAPSSKEKVLVGYSSDGTVIKLANIEQDSRWAAELALTVASAASPNGRDIVVASVSDLTLSGSDIILSRFDERGVRRVTTRVGYSGILYPADVRQAILKRGIGPDRDQAVIASRVPKVLPPLYNILLRDDGIVLLTIRKTDSAQFALLVDANGMTRGAFGLPPKAELIATLGSFVWMKERNSDDIYSVVRYRMMCGARACAFQ